MHHEPTASRVIHWARWYDWFTRALPFVPRIRAKLLELAAPVPGERVLDVGCGTGVLAMAIKSRVGASDVHGIDASPEMIEVANEKAAQAGCEVHWQVALVEALPFPEAHFDLVTCSLVLHHLPGDLRRKGLAEVKRVLKPSGRFVAADFAALSHSVSGHLLSLMGHARGQNTVAELSPLLKEAGFIEVEAIPTRHRKFAFIRAR
jgi:ubiquinone/menaquinone biosynthesis C-methylase UbiE